MRNDRKVWKRTTFVWVAILLGLFAINQDPSHSIPPQIQSSHASNISFQGPIRSSWMTPLAPFTLLVVGVDSREGEAARSDTIMFVSVNPSEREVHVMPIPRDTRSAIEGHGRTKINHAMFYGGLPLLKSTVESFTQQRVDDVAKVNFEGFRKMIDSLGGIDVQVEHRMDYDDPTDGTSIHLAQGLQHLDGKRALDYARFRNDAEADTGRMRRQQQILRSIMAKATSWEAVPKLLDLIQLGKKNIETDITPLQFVQLAQIHMQEPFHVTTETITGVNSIDPSDGIWYFDVDALERQRIQTAIKEWLIRNEETASR